MLLWPQTREEKIMPLTQEQMAAMNASASYDSNITDTRNAALALQGGPLANKILSNSTSWTEKYGAPVNGVAAGVQPVSGAAPQAKSILGGAGKGGIKSKALDPVEDMDLINEQVEKYNNDGNFGYWNQDPDGMYRWVSAFQDATDGGGQDKYGTAFYGGGPISMIGNALKIRPSGMARAKDEKGNYLVDRADIGYRDLKDMRDRGGPQASGGRFEGAGQYSEFANLVAGEQGERELYPTKTDYSKIGLISPPPLPSVYDSRGNMKPKRNIARSLLGMY